MRGAKRFINNKQITAGIVIILIFTIMAIAAPRLSPLSKGLDPERFKQVGKASDMTPHPPSRLAPLGTLPGQSSVYHSLIWGSRQALTFGISVALLTATFGTLFGLISGYIGGRTNKIMMRISDAFLAFPVIAGIVLIQQLSVITYTGIGGMFLLGNAPFTVGPKTPLLALLDAFNPVALAFVLFLWMPYARMTNTIVLQVKQQEYIQAARSVGVKPSRLLFRHVLPNSLTPTIVLVARDVGAFVILQATFTFIGMGGRSIWGEMLSDGRSWVIGPGGNIFIFWWVFLPATLALILFGVGWNLMGDGLNDWLNPRMK